MKLNKAIQNEVMTAEQSKASRELVRKMIANEIKAQAQTAELFEIFKPAIHGHDEAQFKAFQTAFVNAAGFKNASAMSKQDGCKRINVTLSEFKKYCKDFAGEPESYMDMLAEIKAVREAVKAERQLREALEVECEGESTETGLPSGLVNPVLIEFFNKVSAESPEAQAQIAEKLLVAFK
jgi:adenine-specific DNA methylase